MSGLESTLRQHAQASSTAFLVDRILSEGIPDRVLAERALRSTLRVLGERLTDDEAGAVAARLPEELARIVDQAEYDGDFDDAEFYERVRRRAKTAPGTAREHADVVLRAIGEAIDDELRARLVRVLPGSLGRQLLPADTGEIPPHPIAHRTPSFSTLAHGRPGSLHPLSEASPPAGQTHSVARNDDPHGETKLSSARGLTQERHRESLATAKPPIVARTIAEAKDG
jgi:uncharacterized protein (DUF2267 family)